MRAVGDGVFDINFWQSVRAYVTSAGIEAIGAGESEGHVWRKIRMAMLASGLPVSNAMSRSELVRMLSASIQGGGNSGPVLPAFTLNAKTLAVAVAAVAAGSPMDDGMINRHSRMMDRIDASGAVIKGLYLLGKSEAQWMINHASPGTYDLLKVGTPTFTAGSGVSTTDINSYYDTQIPLTALQRNNVSFGFQSPVVAATKQMSSNPDIGAYEGTAGLAGFGSGSAGYASARVFGTIVSQTGGNSYYTGKGWTMWSRLLSSAFRTGHHGVNVAATTSSNSVQATTSTTINILRANGATAPSERTISGAYFGDGLTVAQEAEVVAAITDYVECVRWGAPKIIPAGKGDGLVTKDVIIYGIGNGAIMAANQQVRLGRSVALVGDWFDETIWDIGGMPVNGLDWIDIGISGGARGLFRDALSWINTVYYGRSDTSDQPNLSPEPCAWSAAYRRMLDPTRTGGLIPGADVTVYMSGGIQSVQKSGARVASMTMNDGRKFVGKMFMEASDSGDLIYYAGLPTQTGREAAGTGFESVNGFRGLTGASKPASVDIDPYVTPGDSSSGLLPGIVDLPALAAGAPDPAHQSMNYRLPIYNAQQNGAWLPGPNFAPDVPRNYNPMRYEALGRMFALASSTTLAQLFASHTTVGNSLDANNGTVGISSDLPQSGLNYANAGVNLALRQAIVDDVKDYDIGLFYWLKQSGDARIPSALKTSLASWTWHALSNLDPGTKGQLYFPRRAYVREPTYMLKNSGFILDGNDVAATDGTVPRSIKTAARINYRSDVHSLRLVNSGGVIYTQGGINDSSAGGTDTFAPWPLEASLPDKANCENILVITAPSMSKIAWAAARMEPSMGQIAEFLAYVADAAIANNIAVQDVDYPPIRAAVLANSDSSKLVLPQVN